MTDLMPDLPDPAVDVSAAHEIARDLVVISDKNVPLVPNIGVIGGQEAILVVDTGLGPANGARVAAFADEFAAGRRIYLTSTHFHPEHAFGASAFDSAETTFLVNRNQADDLSRKAPGYLEMFRGFGPMVAGALDKVELVTPDEIYDGTRMLDLGGRTVELRPTRPAHTRGDQVVVVSDADVLFGGDLVETGYFAIFPWFPPYDVEASGLGWIAVMEELLAGSPRTVVPGHGDLGGPERLRNVLDYLRLLRDETWRRRDSGAADEEIIAEVRDVLVKARPDWQGREWIERGVGCFCAEHDNRQETKESK